MAVFIKNKFLPMSADPTRPAGRNTCHEGIGRHIFGYHRTGTDETVLTEGVTAYDGGIGPYGCTTTDDGLAVLILAADGRAGIDDVGEHHRRSQEYIVLAAYAGIDGYVVLDFTVAAQHHVRRDDHVLTDVAVLTDGATGHNMREVPNLGTFAYLATLVHVGRFMNKILSLVVSHLSLDLEEYFQNIVTVSQDEQGDE